MLTSEQVNSIIDEMLLSGAAQSASEAESLFLDTYLDQITELVRHLSVEELERHEAFKLLMSHGSRNWEDALR